MVTLPHSDTVARTCACKPHANVNADSTASTTTAIYRASITCCSNLSSPLRHYRHYPPRQRSCFFATRVRAVFHVLGRERSAVHVHPLTKLERVAYLSSCSVGVGLLEARLSAVVRLLLTCISFIPRFVTVWTFLSFNFFLSFFLSVCVRVASLPALISHTISVFYFCTLSFLVFAPVCAF